MFVRFLFIFLCLALSGCLSIGGKEYPRSQVTTARKMACAGDAGAHINAYYTVYSPEEIGIVYGNQRQALKREESVNGIKYKNSQASFWNKGIDGLLTINDQGMYSCRFLPDDVSFENASTHDDMVSIINDTLAEPAPAPLPVSAGIPTPPPKPVIMATPPKPSIPLPPVKPAYSTN